MHALQATVWLGSALEVTLSTALKGQIGLASYQFSLLSFSARKPMRAGNAIELHSTEFASVTCSVKSS